MLKNLEIKGIYEKGGYLHPEKLYEAICTGIVDLDILIQAI